MMLSLLQGGKKVGIRKNFKFGFYFLEFLRKWNSPFGKWIFFFFGGVGENLTDPSVIKPEEKQ